MFVQRGRLRHSRLQDNLTKYRYKLKLVRIIGLVKENLVPYIKIRTDLMSKEFPSIWIEYKADQNKKSLLMAGFYRVWTKDGEKLTNWKE